MATLISEFDDGLRFHVSNDPIKHRPILLNKGDPLNAFDREVTDDFEDCLHPGGFFDDDSDLHAFFENLAKEPVDLKAMYTAMPIVVYDHELKSCKASKNEEVYCVRLDDEVHERCVESQCIELLKQANCHESCFFRCCENDPWRFYAKLNEKQAEDVRCIPGMWDVSPYYDLEFWCLGCFTTYEKY